MRPALAASHSLGSPPSLRVPDPARRDRNRSRMQLTMSLCTIRQRWARSGAKLIHYAQCTARCSQLGWHVVYASAGRALRSSSCQLSLRSALPAVPHSLARSLHSTLCHCQVTMLSSWASLSLVDGAVDHLGVFTTFVNIVMYGAPLSTLGQVRPRRVVCLTRCKACARPARLPRRAAH